MDTGDIYLAGGIQDSPDAGRGWRDEIGEFLKARDYRVFNPVSLDDEILPRHGFENHKEMHAPEARDRAVAMVKEMAEKDLDVLLWETACMLVYWDDGAETGGGTKGEITFFGAMQADKPIYLVLASGKTRADIPMWTDAFVTQIFQNFDEFKQFVEDGKL